MLLQELLQILDESVTFSVAQLEDYPDHPGQKIYNTAKFQKEVIVDCWVCDGTGKDKYHKDYNCDMCNGSGKIKEYQTPFKELNVANSNAVAILDMLGIDSGDELAGAILEKDLPKIKQKLIKLKNTNTQKYTQDVEVSKGGVRVSKDEHGLNKISSGPTMYDMGRTQEQVTHYIDVLLDLVDYAQKNNAVVVFN